MSDTATYTNAATALAREMRAALRQGNTDRFNSLARERNHMLQWYAGMLPNGPARMGTTTKPPERELRPEIFRKAIQDNHSLLQCARMCLEETRQKIAGLSRRRNLHDRMAHGYGHALTGANLCARG